MDEYFLSVVNDLFPGLNWAIGDRYGGWKGGWLGHIMLHGSDGLSFSVSVRDTGFIVIRGFLPCGNELPHNADFSDHDSVKLAFWLAAGNG